MADRGETSAPAPKAAPETPAPEAAPASNLEKKKARFIHEIIRNLMVSVDGGDSNNFYDNLNNEQLGLEYKYRIFDDNGNLVESIDLGIKILDLINLVSDDFINRYESPTEKSDQYNNLIEQAKTLKTKDDAIITTLKKIFGTDVLTEQGKARMRAFLIDLLKNQIYTLLLNVTKPADQSTQVIQLQNQNAQQLQNFTELLGTVSEKLQSTNTVLNEKQKKFNSQSGPILGGNAHQKHRADKYKTKYLKLKSQLKQ